MSGHLTGLIVVGSLLVVACFQPTYDTPRCGPNGECPNELTCNSHQFCENPGDEIDPLCGDRNVDPGEQCDPGPMDSATCNSKDGGAVGCQLARCGDGYINTAFTPSGGEAPEECDNAGGADTATCNGNNSGNNGPGSCRESTCGDGYVNTAANEQCDNLGGGDSASCNGKSGGAVACRAAKCGDNYVNKAAGELCDATNGADTATCNGNTAGAASCKISTCGDGYVNRAAGEMCEKDADCGPSETCVIGCTACLVASPAVLPVPHAAGTP